MDKKHTIFVLGLVMMLATMIHISSVFAEEVFVHGHKRNNGTIVESYYRTKANGTVSDNYSTKGNVNPYTGRVGSVLNKRNNMDLLENREQKSSERTR